MRVLTVRQPWACAIARLGKDVENRPTNIAGSYRGPIAIHAAALKSAPNERAYLDSALASPYADWTAHRHRLKAFPEPLHYGVVLALATLVDVHHASKVVGIPWCRCSPWAMPNQWHLVLDNIRPLRSPIPHKGGLGLHIAPTDLAAAIREQVRT